MAQAVPVQQAAAAVNNFYNKNVSKLSTFRNNSTDVDTPRDWILRAEQAKDAAQWDDAAALANIALNLAEDAKVWFITLKLNQDYQPTWAYFLSQFKKAFVPALTMKTVHIQSEQIRQKPGETIISFYNRIRLSLEDYRALIPQMELDLEGLPAEAVDATRPGYFQYAAAQIRKYGKHMMRVRCMTLLEIGLLPEYAHFLMTQNYQNNPDVAAELLQEFEQKKHLEKKLLESGASKGFKIAAVHHEQEEEVPAQKEESPEDIYEKIEALYRRIPPRSTGFNKSNNQQSSKPENRSYNQSSSNSNSNSNPIKCLFCGKTGHTQVKCFKRKENNMPCIGKDKEPWYPKGEKNRFEQKKQDFQK